VTNRAVLERMRSAYQDVWATVAHPLGDRSRELREQERARCDV
jgi:hypothetical protein